MTAGFEAEWRAALERLERACAQLEQGSPDEASSYAALLAERGEAIAQLGRLATTAAPGDIPPESLARLEAAFRAGAACQHRLRLVRAATLQDHHRLGTGRNYLARVRPWPPPAGSHDYSG